MRNISVVKPLSDAIASPIIKAYKAGGLGLVFIFIGILLLLVALFFGRGITGYIVGILGSLVILTVLYLFYFQSIKPLKDINDRIQQNRELIDTVQQTALQMTNLSYDLQSLAFKYADEVASLISQLRQNIKLLSDIPGFNKLGKLADKQYVLKTEDLSTAIVEVTASAKTIIEEIQKALVEANPQILKKYLSQVQELDLKTKQLLKK